MLGFLGLKGRGRVGKVSSLPTQSSSGRPPLIAARASLAGAVKAVKSLGAKHLHPKSLTLYPLEWYNDTVGEAK